VEYGIVVKISRVEIRWLGQCFEVGGALREPGHDVHEHGTAFGWLSLFRKTPIGEHQTENRNPFSVSCNQQLWLMPASRTSNTWRMDQENGDCS
jgi:hypothetical protein